MSINELEWFVCKREGGLGIRRMCHLVKDGKALCGLTRRQGQVEPNFISWKTKNPNKQCKRCLGILDGTLYKKVND